MIRNLVIAIGLVVAACDDTVDPITKITGPRVLAVETEPSVLALDGVLQLTALTVDPDGPRTGERPVDAVRMRACAPWKFVSDPALDCAGLDALALVTDDQGRVTVSSQALEAAFPSPPGIDAPPDPWGAVIAAGVPLRVPVIVEIEVDGLTLTARRDITVVDPMVAHQNPRISEVRFDGVVTTTLRPDQRYVLTVAIDPASLDEGLLDDDTPGEREQVGTRLYSPAGALADTSVELDDPDAELPESEPTAYTTGAPGPTWLFVVAVDQTGGMSLVSVPLVIE